MSDAPAVSRGGVDASGHASDYSESTTDEKGPLPDGWRLIVNGGHRFYYHAFSDVSQWLRPKGAPPKQDPLPPGWEQVTDGEDVFYYHAASDTSVWERPHAPSQGLPHGWRRCYDHDGDVFYHNTVSGESSWEVPTEPASNTTPSSNPAPAPSPASPAAAVVAPAAAPAPAPAPAPAARASKVLAARESSTSGGGRRRSSWRLLRVMVKTRMALNQQLSKAKRRRLRRGVFAHKTDAKGDLKLRPDSIPGDPPASEASTAAIAKAMQHFLFKSLPPGQREAVVLGMRRREFAAGDMIITQGHTDSNVYVLESGRVDFSVDNKPSGAADHAGKLFGELALLYDAPRNGSAKAVTACVTWVLTASTFRALVRQAAHEEQRARRVLVEGVPSLMAICDSGAGVNADREELISAMSSELTAMSFAPGQEIVALDAPLLGTYIIKSGSVLGSMDRTLETGDFFGVSDYRGDAPVSYETMTAGPEGSVVFLLHRTALRLVVQGAQKRVDMARSERKEADVPRISLSDVEELGPLGEGSFGVVKMVRWRGEVAALKALSKFHVSQARQVQHVIRERRLLGSVRHPSVVNLQATAVDNNKLYMLLELVQGGELWSLIYNESSPLTRGCGGMSDDAARFYAANIILGLEFLHSQDIAFRDLKPENLLVTSTGYLKFVDFGFAKRIPYLDNGTLKIKSGTMLGSPDYLAPELILRHGHDHTVDLWALGVIIYEMLAGEPAFDEPNRNEGYERACRADVQFNGDIQKRSPHGCDLIRALLVVDPRGRLGDGTKGMARLKAHAWFDGFDWDALSRHTLAAPYVPKLSGADDRSHFEVEGSDDEDEDDSEKPDMDAAYTGDQSVWEGF